MAEAGLFIGWGEVVRGREKRALENFNDTAEYVGRLQQEGKIERFDVAILTPHGSDLGGFWLVRGTAEQIDSLTRDEDFQRRIARVRLLVDRLGVVDAFVDEGLATVTSQYQDELKGLD